MNVSSADLELGPLTLRPGHSLTLEERWGLLDEAAWLMKKGIHLSESVKISSRKKKSKLNCK